MNISKNNFKILFLFMMVVLDSAGVVCLAQASEKLEIYRGATPEIDGIVSSGEYDDAVEFYGVRGWMSQFDSVTDDNDLAMKGWAKHDGNNVYFAFDITDDVLYGIDTKRWLPKEFPKAHDLSPEGLPWFGDGIELMIQAAMDANVRDGQHNSGNGRSWQMVCNLTKSRLGGVGIGGLLEGEERIKPATWNNYQAWITNDDMRAVAKPKPGGRGYIIEWMIKGNPCLEVRHGKFWDANCGEIRMGFNIVVQDLDQKERGSDNYCNFHHEQWWAGQKDKGTELNQWGTLVIHPGARPKVIYVTTRGSDTGDGSREKPFASIVSARDLIRKLKADGKFDRPIDVVVGEGTYPLVESIVFEPADSGMLEYPIIYRAASESKPVFSGGRIIVGFSRGMDGVWYADIDDVNKGRWYFEQLFVNDHRAVRARIPNKFYHYITHKVSEFKAEEKPNSAFVAEHNDIVLLRSLPLNKLKDVTAVSYLSWTISRNRIEAVDPNYDIVYLTGPAGRPFMEGPSQRYHLENIKSESMAAGQWYLDRGGKVFYRPLADEDMNTAVVVAPVAERFLELRGDPCNGRFVENIQFEGLAFKYGNYALPQRGLIDTQAATGQSAYAADNVNAVIMVDGARNVKFADCEIAHIGSCGIWFRNGCNDSSVERCGIYDFGASGIRIGGDSESAKLDKNIKIDNNIIRSGGRIHMGAVGVLVGDSGDNQVSHNDISDMWYTGISVGWKWDYGTSHAVRNKIEFNHIHHIGQGVLSDMGGIYTLGESPGTTVRNNVIHDIYSYDYFGRGGWGIYTDEASSYILVENNLVYKTKTGSYSLHYGNDLVIRNNIFALAMDGQLQRVPSGIWRRAKHGRIWFENNIIYWNRGSLFYTDDWNGWDDDRIISGNNVYWNASGRLVEFENDMSLSDWQKRGHETNSIVTDPCFVDVEHYDFNLKPDSSAIKKGFRPFDYSMAGVYGSSQWIAKAHDWNYKPVEFAPEPKPMWLPQTVHEDFEAVSIGVLPTNSKADVENAGDTVAICDEMPAGGKRCLKITDALGLLFTENPKFYYDTCFASGTTKVSFDLKFGKNADIEHELRDVVRGHIGPKFRIYDSMLVISGQNLMILPENQWIHFEITSRQGVGCDGTWDLLVIMPDQSAKEFKGLKNQTPSWERTTRVVFMSTSARESQFYLDNIEITNSELQ